MPYVRPGLVRGPGASIRLLVFHPYAEAASMKFLSQMGLALVAVVVVVFLATWVSQQVDTTEDTATVTGTSATKPADQSNTQQPPAELTFPISIMQWDPPTAGEIEVRTSGHHDFWFENRNSIPVHFGL